MAHSCEEDDHNNLVQYCCVSKMWRAVLFAVPKLWYCIVRTEGQQETHQAVAHISRAVNCPLHLSFRMSSHDNEIHKFLPLLQKYSDRWQRIEILGRQLRLLQKVLSFTMFSQLPLLEYLVVRKVPTTFHCFPIGKFLLTCAPRLTTLDVSSFIFLHFSPLTSLVSVTLSPCYVTRHIIDALANSPIETLKLGSCTWTYVFSSAIHFPYLARFTVDGIEWATLRDLLHVLVAPRLVHLDIMLELDQATGEIDMEDSVQLSHQLPSVTHLTITALCIDASMEHVPALIYLFGWKFLSVTHFTTNLPVEYICALHTFAHDLRLPYVLEALGFSLSNISSVPNSIPAVLFPRLVELRCSNTYIHYSPQVLIAIAQYRRDLGCPLYSITCHFDRLLDDDLSQLNCFVEELHDWKEDEIDFSDGETIY